MSERKVLNKYNPPDFDPAKIPKLKLPKDRQYVVRLMAPFNMRCKTCGEYIYKGKKFNARKETTDPENTDYAMEHGATRNFQAEKLIEQEETKIQREREEEELNNPMKVLENRTRDSKLEMEVLENLQELKELNQRQAQVDFEGMIGQYRALENREKEREKEEDERETQEMLDRALMKRLRDSDSDSDLEERSSRPPPQSPTADQPTDILTRCLGGGGEETQGGVLGEECGEAGGGRSPGLDGGQEETWRLRWPSSTPCWLQRQTRFYRGGSCSQWRC
ncbi:hypothetical protein CRUP_013587 [Coryphaenoides rupestris]|nr:hypothetical protein CRUP_013587 [Coryphaenoides rupestris]